MSEPRTPADELFRDELNAKLLAELEAQTARAVEFFQAEEAGRQAALEELAALNSEALNRLLR